MTNKFFVYFKLKKRFSFRMKMNSSKQFYVDSNHDDDEQVKSTLKFFDSILEEYLDDEENQSNKKKAFCVNRKLVFSFYLDHRLSSSVIDLSRLNLNYSRPVGRVRQQNKKRNERNQDDCRHILFLFHFFRRTTVRKLRFIKNHWHFHRPIYVTKLNHTRKICPERINDRPSLNP